MKHSTVKGVVAFILAAMLTVSLFCSCSDNDNQGAGTTNEGTKAEAVVTTEDTSYLYDADGYLKDLIPEDLKYEGTVIRELIWSDDSTPEFGITEEQEDIVKNSVYRRNNRVEDRLKITLEEVGTPGNSSNRENYLTAATTAAAGGDFYDIYASYSMSTTLCAYNGLCRDLLEYPIIDFAKPWWPDSLIEEATIRGKLYYASGDITHSLINNLYGIFFNKDIMNSYKLEDVYSLIKNNNWTFEKYFELSGAINTDPNATNPVYGCSFPSKTYTDAFFAAAGLRTTDHNEDGTIKISELFNSERTVDVCDELWDFLHSNVCILADSKIALFTAESTLFSVITLNYGKYLPSVTFSYGIAPMPKYNPDQENYSSCVGNAFTMYAITSSSKNPEAAAATMECLASEGYRNITPMVFEVTMKAKISEEPNAANSYEIIRSSANFDFGKINGPQFSSLTYSIFRKNITGDTKTAFSTSFEASEETLKKSVEDVNANYGTSKAAS